MESALQQQIKGKQSSEMQLFVSDSSSEHEQRQPIETDNHGPISSRSVATTIRLNRSTVGDSILSDDLRDQFEVMKRISRQAQRRNLNNGTGVDVDDIHSETDHKNSHHPELKHKVRETAIETAIKVDNEINQWRDEIANLEALLLAEEDDDEDSLSSTDDDQYNNEVELGITEIAFVVQNHNENDDDGDEEHC